MVRAYRILFLAAVVFWASDATAVSPEVCSKIGGQWRVHPNWTEDCVIRTTLEDCKNFKQYGVVGYAGYPRNECVVYMTTDEQIARCNEYGGDWDLHGAERPHCYYEQIEKECIAKGGTWKPDGRSRIPGCVEKSMDAGKPCKDGSECQFKNCIYTGAHLPIGSVAEGICRSTNSVFGCYTSVRDGKVRGEICVD